MENKTQGHLFAPGRSSAQGAPFNAAAYWSGKAKKIYVVTLEGGSCLLSKRTEERLIRAGCDLAAESTAKARSYLSYPRVIGSRLATPADLLAEYGSENFHFQK